MAAAWSLFPRSHRQLALTRAVRLQGFSVNQNVFLGRAGLRQIGPQREAPSLWAPWIVVP